MTKIDQIIMNDRYVLLLLSRLCIFCV